MKTFTIGTAALLGLGALTAMGAPEPEGGERRSPRGPSFEQFDTDSDGVLNKEEWTAMRKRFADRQAASSSPQRQGPGPSDARRNRPQRSDQRGPKMRPRGFQQGGPRGERPQAQARRGPQMRPPQGSDFRGPRFQGSGPRGPGMQRPQRPRQGPWARGPQRFAQNGRGGPRGPFQHPPFLDRFDDNDDGKLDRNERQEMRERFENRQGENPRPPRDRGQRD